jgi:hypothetical protein
MSDEPMRPFSDAAYERLAALEAKEARGERIGWSDLVGIAEPNPALSDCQSCDIDSGVQCSRPNRHEGPHRAEVTW